MVRIEMTFEPIVGLNGGGSVARGLRIEYSFAASMKSRSSPKEYYSAA
jgi:hypothetical protein